MKIPHIKTPLPGPKAKAIVERDHQSRRRLTGGFIRWSSNRRKAWCVEDVDGNLFLDFMAGIAVASTGHSHPRVVKAIEEQATKFLHICGSDYYYEPMVELAEKLNRLAPAPRPEKVFHQLRRGNRGSRYQAGALPHQTPAHDRFSWRFSRPARSARYR